MIYEMADLNKDRIFNESCKKVLLREFENLKKDYNKMNVLKYKSLYENESLSFILDNSRYIFSEPMKGLEFYERLYNNNRSRSSWDNCSNIFTKIKFKLLYNRKII